MYEFAFVLAFFLSVLTIAILAVYYKWLRGIKREYEDAKNVLQDIIISFSRQQRRQEDRLGVVAHKIEAFSSKTDRAMKNIEENDGQLRELTSKVASFSDAQNKLSVQIDDLNKKVVDIAEEKGVMLKKITEIESAMASRPSTLGETQLETVIPIKKEKALAPLTETEVAVLEILANEGEKTAPEIKDRIKLTREHTARLMKKLYGEGYLERTMQKIPYAYRIKEEMVKILKKAESKA